MGTAVPHGTRILYNVPIGTHELDLGMCMKAPLWDLEHP